MHGFSDSKPAPAGAALLPVSSGDLLVDRRYAIARDLGARGDLAGAADLLAQTLERQPTFAAAWFALAELRERLGDRAAAGEAFRRALALDPDDPQGAAPRLARLEARIEPMPPAYVRALFDQYAARYDHALVEALAYCGPRLLRDAVESVQAERKLALRFRRMLDLGCGTGLAGEAFASCCDAMTGIDLSAAMIEQARRKKLYRELLVSDLVEALAREREPADLIVAADAFVYLADLKPVCRAAARLLERDGLFAFTTETHDGTGVVLGDQLRYAHSPAHVRAALDAAGLSLLTLVPASPRREGGVPVPGLVVVAARADAASAAG